MKPERTRTVAAPVPAKLPEELRTLARKVFGSDEKAAHWFASPVRALGAKTPLSQMATKTGARRVEQVLGRIAHGVYS
jgi:putative toxin-antitoxin system antitoxin component (TIGR02293 family)